MSVLKNVTKALKVTGQGAAKVSSGMMKVATGVSKTAGKVANFITGGKREQSYGYTSQYFPMSKKNKYKTKSKITPIRSKITNITATPITQSSTNNEQFSNMFDYLKRMHEQNMTRLEVQNSFMEERRNEEENRHEELLTAIKKFTDTDTATIVKEKKDSEPGLLDIFKNMLSSAISGVLSTVTQLIEGIKAAFDWVKDLKILTTLGSSLKTFVSFVPRILTFLASPLGVALLAGTAVGLLLYEMKKLKEEIESNPNDEKFRDNPYAMTLRGETKTIAQAAEANRRKTVKSYNRPEIENAVKSNLPDDILIDVYGMDKLNLQKWLTDNPKQMKYQAPVKPIVGLPRTGAEAGEIARTLATPLPSDVKPSTAGAGRGSPEIFDPRRLDTPKETSASQISPQSVDTKRMDTPKAVPVAPLPSPVSNLIQENKDLEDQVAISGTVTQPIVSVNGSSQLIDTPPIPSTATWRDDEPMVDRVLQKTRAYV